MISQTSDPNIETINSRIQKGIYDLQPDFQRGEVWDVNKKRKLIDSILRDWHIPPIHLVYVKDSGKHEVLDGQQRLAAIRDFINNQFGVFGDEIPLDPLIKELDGLKFSDFPEKVKNKFLDYTIRVFIIKEYLPEEPGELFYRLNQSTTLSPAEQRNSFYGVPRNQVKNLSGYMSHLGLDKSVLGFSNARMAHDDMLAKVCFTLENKSLKKPASSKNITMKYRRGEPFDENAIEKATQSLEIFSDCLSQFDTNIRFNKSTMYSLLCFISQLDSYIDTQFLGKFIYNFETSKNNSRNILFTYYDLEIPEEVVEDLLNLYNDRASYRAENTSSIKLRDLVLWIFMYLTYDKFNLKYPEQQKLLSKLIQTISESYDSNYSSANLAYILEEFLENYWDNEL
ncbi:DUF262 domain-containing protein [Exiguobacterium sp. SH0S2]|uniref:DUF262 domain-containing protein n=1 Tax=Exiguobacterium sp. SH0S2 TaxID=2510950 RepID=UPI00103E8791|nr:DUF262 domain-containing protein [Exiguobacterium sp. SH0S2]TCI62853.1 DUF262 domain-containing protein [Exiguobacterium sp. SH0S2]